MGSVVETVASELAKEIGGSIQAPKPEGIFLFSYDTKHSIIGKFGGRAVAVDIQPWGEISIKYDCNTTYRFQIRPNSFLARISLIAAKRISTGDKEFDESLLVRTNYREISTWLARREIREIIASLKPFSELAVRKNLLQYYSKVELDKPRTDEITTKLNILNNIAASLEKES